MSANLSLINEEELREHDAEVRSVAVYESPLAFAAAIDIVGATFLVHEYGVRSRLRLAAVGDDPVVREPGDSQETRVAAAIRLPRAGTHGQIAIHRGHGKSASRAVKTAIKRTARDFGLTASITPRIVDSELLDAVRHNRITAVEMLPIDKKSLFRSRARGDGQVASDVEVRFSATVRRGFLTVPVALKNFILQNNRDATIVLEDEEYGGVRVTVELGDGRKRTFTVGSTTEGFAFAYDIELEDDDFDVLGPMPSAIEKPLAVQLLV